jgi:hypothetical protein
VDDPCTQPDIKDVSESVQYHYQAAADHHVLNSAEATTPVENTAIIHAAPFLMLVLIILSFANLTWFYFYFQPVKLLIS